MPHHSFNRDARQFTVVIEPLGLELQLYDCIRAIVLGSDDNDGDCRDGGGDDNSGDCGVEVMTMVVPVVMLPCFCLGFSDGEAQHFVHTLRALSEMFLAQGDQNLVATLCNFR